MRKILSTAVLIFGLLSSSHANAYDASSLLQGLQLVQETLSAVADAAIQAAAETSAAVDEWVQNTAWVQQAKDMLTTIEKLQAGIDKAQAVSDKATSLITGPRGMGGALADGSYKYKKEALPSTFTPQINCADGSNCTAVGNGYFGSAAAVSSKALRDTLKVDSLTIGAGNTIRQISAEAAEKNAQELAVIQAMAQEAYVVTNNRIAMIEDLKNQINNPIDTSKDDAKYIANLQAQLQSQQALLGNEQNKLTALAILQQSQRDAYEQRKREIASYVVNGDADNHTVGRALISTVQKSAYAAVAAAYK